jgi:hypothetical protein
LYRDRKYMKLVGYGVCHAFTPEQMVYETGNSRVCMHPSKVSVVVSDLVLDRERGHWVRSENIVFSGKLSFTIVL